MNGQQIPSDIAGTPLVQRTPPMKLQTAWTARLKFWAEGDKLWAEGAKLWAEGAKLRAEGDKLWAEGAKLRAEGAKLWAEGDKLWAEGDKLWAEAILEVHGNITLEWKCRGDIVDCHLGTGDTFRGDEPVVTEESV